MNSKLFTFFFFFQFNSWCQNIVSFSKKHKMFTIELELSKLFSKAAEVLHRLLKSYCIVLSVSVFTDDFGSCLEGSICLEKILKSYHTESNEWVQILHRL